MSDAPTHLRRETYLTLDQVSVHQDGSGQIWFKWPTHGESEDGFWFDDGLSIGGDALEWARAAGRRIRVILEVEKP